MNPEERSRRLLGITRSKAKMYEYGIPERDHLRIPAGSDPTNLFSLAVGILGDSAAGVGNALVGDAAIEPSALGFATRFFDAFLEARLDSRLNAYLLLVGSAAYYLNDRPGSSQVLARRVGDTLDLGSRSLEDLLYWLLRDDWLQPLTGRNGRYGQHIGRLSECLSAYATTGEEPESSEVVTSELRDLAYRFGTSRELFFSDLIRAIAKRRMERSSWTCLPRYSGIDKSHWRPTLQKASFTRELWPAQIVLGEAGVFAGKSAVVQFPTSAGKTHAVEMVLRSAFLSERARVAVVVAPFRALCHEIGNRLIQAFGGEAVEVNEVSDVLQLDLLDDLAEFLGGTLRQSKIILVLTPEKLLYTLRHWPEISKHIGLLVLDEGHQFDSGSRGVTYELLVTALKPLLPPNVQILLISAVIPNAAQIAEWLIGKGAVSVLGNNLIATERVIAFSSWDTARGQLQFVDPAQTDKEEFFVPRVLEETSLRLQRNETKKRVFPERNDGRSIAAYLGLKLFPQGGIAIFCGRKDAAASLADLMVDAFGRGLAMPKPSEASDSEEMQRLLHLHKEHFGEQESVTQCAEWGIYFHHGNTPHGLRLAVEHAMKAGLARFVICTSTLSQGVNLPIRYLIVTSIYQGQERIKVRDFHNLIGRTGRSGMHTEGTILFSDPGIYDMRLDPRDRWRWGVVHELLQPTNVEPCSSALLSILEPLRSDDKKFTIGLTASDFLEAYIADTEALYKSIERFADQHKSQGFSREGLIRQVDSKIALLCAIESYLMAHRDTSSPASFSEESTRLARQTLAYFLADAEKQLELVSVFQRLAAHIETRIPDTEQQKRYGKTLLGVFDAIVVEEWVTTNADALLLCGREEDLLEVLWPLLESNIAHTLFNKCDLPSALKKLAFDWIRGVSYHQMFQSFSESGAKRMWGKRKRAFKMDDIVDLCENAYGYDTTLIISGVADLLEQAKPDGSADAKSLLVNLQKRLRYGLPDPTCVLIHEVGFADRVVAMDLRTLIQSDDVSRRSLLSSIKEMKEPIEERLVRYPSYFHSVHSNLTS